MQELARATGKDGTDRLTLLATAHNKAALIASDCGLPELARSLCWRQFRIYQQARPLNGHTAQLALQPIINLARLLIRADDGQGAHQLLDALYQAVRTRTDTMLDGQAVDFGNLTASDEDHRTLCRWLWTVLLGDGTRALVRAGNWEQVLAHAEQHHGVGARLLDGRQIAILARCVFGDHASALTILNESVTPTSWERAVARCLNVLCLRFIGRSAIPHVTAMTTSYLDLEATQERIVFRARLGLCVVDLTTDVCRKITSHVVAGIVREALTATDAYAAREVLSNETCQSHMAPTDRNSLTGLVGLKRNSPSHNPAQRWQQIIAAGDPNAYLDWFTASGCWGVVPLNKLPDLDDGRVKSYRKQLRDGILPPDQTL